MKKIHLLVILLLAILPIRVSAQDFAPIGAEWHYTKWFASFWPKESYVKIRSIGDTIIQGKSCRILENNGGYSCTFHNERDYVYTEDSVTYFYVPAIDSFQILYDLRASEGSSWIVVFSVDIIPLMDTVRISVVSVDNVTINGKVLKRFLVYYEYLSGWTSSGGPRYIIEGIGSQSYLFDFKTTWALCHGTYSGGLRCYEDSVIGFYSTGIADSCTYTNDGTGLSSISADQMIRTYPNPTSGFLFIETDLRSPLEIRLLNPLGGVEIEDKMVGTHQLDLSGLPVGLYFLEFQDLDKRRSVRRIIKY